MEHAVADFRVWEKKTCSPQVTTDSDTVFREESIGEGFKIVTVAVFEKILLFEKKIGSSLTSIFKPTCAVTIFFSKIEIIDKLFPLLTYLQHFAEKSTVFELYILQVSVQMRKIAITLKITLKIEEKSYFFALFQQGKAVCKHDQIMYSGPDNFYVPSFASKLLLKEVICKKKRQKRLSSTESSTYRDFSHLNAYL